MLSGPAIQNLNGSQLDELVVTDTIPLSDAAAACAKIRQLSVAQLRRQWPETQALLDGLVESLPGRPGCSSS